MKIARKVLATVLNDLGYNILSAHTITADKKILEMYVRVSEYKAIRLKRHDILSKLYNKAVISFV
jgi:hypothetical protein